jgi:hypothetical protein
MLLTRFAYRPLLQRGSHLLVGQCILRWPVLLGMVILPLLASGLAAPVFAGPVTTGRAGGLPDAGVCMLAVLA